MGFTSYRVVFVAENANQRSVKVKFNYKPLITHGSLVLWIWK